MANIYFLIIAVMQSINEISISGGKPVILLPLSIVVFINGLKDFLEDWKRKKSDDEENRRKCEILNINTKQFEERRWGDIKLGQILKVSEKDYFPADLILINSSEQNGIGYVETKNLDGETNLKFKQSNNILLENFQDEDQLSRFTGTVECRKPNEFIYEFDAKLRFLARNGAGGAQRAQPPTDYIYIDKKSFLLRGCSLRQTEFVYGLVVYVGHNTKIMKNSPSARSKTSKIEQIMNFQIIIIFSLQLALSITGAVFYIIWYADFLNEIEWYIFPNQNSWSLNTSISVVGFLLARVGTWILIFTNLVPISLLVTMEMVKYIQGMFIQWDINIYDTDKQVPARVQTSTLNEELGQVKYIFSDKTGTLTKNYMEFKKMSIGTFVYGSTEEDNPIGYKYDDINSPRDDNGNQSSKKKKVKDDKKYIDEKGLITNVWFDDNNFQSHQTDTLHENYENITLFLECLALCHTVITDAKEEEHGRLVYQASSPDESALVNAARLFKVIFKGRDIENNVTLEVNGKDQIYRVLNLLEYSSERKRMSVVVKCPDGKIRLFTKGADSIVRELITLNKDLVSITDSHLLAFAKEGLRTLMIAYKEVDESEYEKWNKEFMDAVTDPEQKEKLLPPILEKMEKDLYLLGSTAIEDQLQDDVGKTLEIFIKTGIKVWMLTGDKMDTAKSIAFSCKLITHEFNIFEIHEGSTKKEITENIKIALNSLAVDPLNKFALVIGADELNKITQDAILTELFYELAIRCNSVVCCRVSPKQKAQMVNLVKNRQENMTTLAIGDGANDVNMITSAHIGIGIVGVEGRQAARASDYSIGEFSFLRRLLLVHGRESYRKNSYVVCYNFYKNVLFVMPQFWFGFVSYFSGQTLYDPWIYQLYNIFFASLPIIWFGIYDKEVPYELLYNDSRYYIQGVINKLFHSQRFWKWVFYGILQGFILFLICFFSNNSSLPYGETQDMWSVGTMIFGFVVIMVNLKILFSTNTHSYISFAIFFISIANYWIVVLAMSHYYIFENFNHLWMLFISPWFYFTLFLVFAITLIMEVGVSKLLMLFGIVKDPLKIKPEKIDSYLHLNLSETNKLIETKVNNRCNYLINLIN
jgi:phospholipid-transporting ATPase